MSDSQQVASGFADRLKTALERSGFPDERGRAAIVARKTKASHVAVKKWLDGQGLPDMKHQIVLAQWLNVSINWLSTGQGNMEVINMDSETMALAKMIQRMDSRGRQMMRTVAETQMPYAA